MLEQSDFVFQDEPGTTVQFGANSDKHTDRLPTVTCTIRLCATEYNSTRLVHRIAASLFMFTCGTVLAPT